MRVEETKKNKWERFSKAVVKRWFSFKSKCQASHFDRRAKRGDADWRISFSESDACTGSKSKTEKYLRKKTHDQVRGKIDIDAAQVTEIQDYKIFVATWNVGGKSPSSSMNLEEWLHSSPPADIYVLGFQEIVPLNAGNVLGAEDNEPARKWVALVRKTLNGPPGNGSGGYASCQTPSPVPEPVVEIDDDFEGSSVGPTTSSSFFHRRSFQSFGRRSLRVEGDTANTYTINKLGRCSSVCDRRPSNVDQNFRLGVSSDDEIISGAGSPSTDPFSPVSYSSFAHRRTSDDAFLRGINGDHGGGSRYCMVASKQMVGLFLMVWIRSEIRLHIRNMKISCVGRGLMGYLGNKGSISISLYLHQTSFCFVCSHLTSGQKEGDEHRRNSDVLEILRKTRFPSFHDSRSPDTILEHDRIIWLGDLNYRIALSYRAVKALVQMRNWRALLEKDQLRVEQARGHVFNGWKEGRIYFPPTYKYSDNSDRYAGDNTHIKEKRRTPAWCDRILWYGNGLHQLSYLRGESRFSDHRPVYTIFAAEVELINHGRIRSMGGGGCSSSQTNANFIQPIDYTDINFY